MKLLLPLLLFAGSGMLGACASADNGSAGGTLNPGVISTGPGGGTKRPPSSSSSSSGAEQDEPPGPIICPMDVPLSNADLDKEIGWKPGSPAQGSCSTADISQLESNFKSTSITTYFDLAKGVSDTCHACVVSKDTDAKWGPIVGTAENNGETGFVNYGACFGAIEGDACGKAIQYEAFCQNIACNECVTTESERAKCISAASAAGNMCESFTNEKTKSCPSWSLNVKSCGDVLTAIKTLCGAPS